MFCDRQHRSLSRGGGQLAAGPCEGFVCVIVVVHLYRQIAQIQCLPAGVRQVGGLGSNLDSAHGLFGGGDRYSLADGFRIVAAVLRLCKEVVGRIGGQTRKLTPCLPVVRSFIQGVVSVSNRCASIAGFYYSLIQSNLRGAVRLPGKRNLIRDCHLYRSRLRRHIIRLYKFCGKGVLPSAEVHLCGVDGEGQLTAGGNIFCLGKLPITFINRHLTRCGCGKCQRIVGRGLAGGLGGHGNGDGVAIGIGLVLLVHRHSAVKLGCRLRDGEGRRFCAGIIAFAGSSDSDHTGVGEIICTAVTVFIAEFVVCAAAQGFSVQLYRHSWSFRFSVISERPAAHRYLRLRNRGQVDCHLYRSRLRRHIIRLHKFCGKGVLPSAEVHLCGVDGEGQLTAGGNIFCLGKLPITFVNRHLTRCGCGKYQRIVGRGYAGGLGGHGNGDGVAVGIGLVLLIYRHSAVKLGCRLCDGEAHRFRASIVFLSSDGDSGLSRVGIILIINFVICTCGQSCFA